LISILTVASAQVDPCDARLRPVADHSGYSRRGDRCEGFYVSPVAVTDFEVVSLLRGKLYFNLQPHVRLEVLAPNAPGVIQGPVLVRAVALPPRVYYRMDATVPVNRPLIWPVDALLLPWRLDANKVGMFGWVGTEGERTFVPLQVVPSGAPQPAGPVELVVRSAADVESVKWRSSDGSDQRPSPPVWRDAVTTPVPAGRPVTIVLPDGPTAVLRVEVAAKEQHRDRWSTLSIRMIRPGLP